MLQRRTSLTLAALMLGALSFAGGESTTAEAATPACSALSHAGYERINRGTTATLITPWRTEATRATRYGFNWNRGTPYRVSVRSAAGLVPVHRLYRAKTHDFRYVWSSTEIAGLKRTGYRDQGRAFYAAKSSASCVRPVYRYARAGVTQYAVTAARRASLVRNHWRYQKVAFYVRTATTAPAAAITPLSQKLYVPTNNYAWRAYRAATNRTTKRLLYQIAGTSSAMWLGGASTDGALVRRITAAASAQHRTPVWVLYAIPNRDCNGAWSGGLSGATAYDRWINAIRAGINNKPAVVIVEPDAIGMNCLTAAQRTARIAMLRYAMKTLSQDKNTWLYIHGGSYGLYVPTFARILKQVGVGYGRGFALNVSGFDTTAREMKYGDALLRTLKTLGVTGKRYVIDTSRNGLGRQPGGSCNARGAALGKRPTTATGSSSVAAWLWIKPPGETDGKCQAGDPASGWFQWYALDITQRAIDHRIISEWNLP
jgi:endoglucanase